MAQVVDDARVGTKGFPRHWRELGLDAPMREVPDAQGGSALSVPPTKAQLKAYAADRRWRKETGGVTLPNDVVVKTDDAAQRKVAELRRRAADGEIALPFGFKAETGWIDADLPVIEAIDQAIAAHVAACYALERQIDGDIEAGAVTTTAQIDAAFAG